MAELGEAQAAAAGSTRAADPISPAATAFLVGWAAGPGSSCVAGGFATWARALARWAGPGVRAVGFR
jgi:hypothetical protein